MWARPPSARFLRPAQTAGRSPPWGISPSASARRSSIFDEVSRERRPPPISGDEWEKAERLAYEKESLGLYVSEHPLDGIKDALRRKTDCAVVELERRRDGDIVTVGGIVGALRQTTTKKGDPMVFLRLDDVTGSVEAIVFNSVYAAARELLEADRILVLKGRVDHKEGETKLIALELAELLKHFPGEAPVTATVETSAGRLTLEFGPDYRVRPEPDLFAEVKTLLGEAAIT